ncbi:MAG: hypothetical protein GY810_03270 [Aureispira sp.]|nr:hypothetical protein [Aureispira sp.]
MINSDYRVLSQEKYSYDIPFTGTTLRLMFWKFGKEIITEQKAWLYGVGVGDSQELLDKKMIDYNLKDSGYLGYNFHSQYIETIVEIGLIGLNLLAFILISFFRKMLAVQNIVGIILVIIVATLFLTESALEKHRGIVFLMFFISILSTETKLET